jgi:hypothetical protein
LLHGFFDQEQEPLMVVGGLAMLTYGATRNTYDCDLLARSALRPKLRTFLEAAGYRTESETPAFSNHINPDPDLGRLDVLYVDDETARQVFSAKRQTQLGAHSPVDVPSPDHLIAMKTQSLRSDPDRRSDVEDLQLLLAREDVDQKEAARQFEANGLSELHHAIVERLQRR